MQLTVSQIAAQIAAQTTSLEAMKRRCFLEWLQAHSSGVGLLGQSRFDLTEADQDDEIFENHLKGALIIWLDSLPAGGVIWEYGLILHELAWWRALDEESLGLILNTTDRDSMDSSSSSDSSRILF